MRRIRQIQDDLKHCAPPDRHVATQIAMWPQDLTYIQKKNARNTYYAQDKSDSGRPQTLRAPRSPRGHPDRHVATIFNMYSEEKCAQHILRAVVGQEENHPSHQPPAAGLMTQHQDVYYIPPPRVVGGTRGNSAPVSTATLGLIHRHDPSLAAQLREDPGSMMTQSTRRRVYSTMRLIRTGMLGQLASLQQWEEAMHRQDDA